MLRDAILVLGFTALVYSLRRNEVSLTRLEKRMAGIEQRIQEATTSTSAAIDAATAALEDISGDIDELKNLIAQDTVSPETADAVEALNTKVSGFVDALKAAADKVPEETPLAPVAGA